MVNELMNMKFMNVKTWGLTVWQILLIVIGVAGILYLALLLVMMNVMNVVFSDTFELLAGAHKGYSYDETVEYFYANKKVFDAIETSILAIMNDNTINGHDNVSARQQYIKQSIDSLIARIPSKPENFAVCVKQNELFITMGSGCGFQTTCHRLGYVWTSRLIDDINEDGWGHLYKNVDVKILSGKWLYYVYDNDYYPRAECETEFTTYTDST